MQQRRDLATLVLLITLELVVSAQSPGSFTGRVVGVLDVDSLLVLDGRRQIDVRLHGVDAPEGSQAYGSVCKRTLSNLVFGKAVAVQVIDTDRYKRSVSRVTVDGRDAGLEVIRAGCAWHYRQYSDDPGYAAAEQDARRARRGLWQDAPGCVNYDCKNCTAVFATREAAVAAGYRPHVGCAGR